MELRDLPNYDPTTQTLDVPPNAVTCEICPKDLATNPVLRKNLKKVHGAQLSKSKPGPAKKNAAADRHDYYENSGICP